MPKIKAIGTGSRYDVMTLMSIHNMISLDTALLFTGVSALMAISPGPDNLFVLVQSALSGVKAGIWIVLGLCTGLLFHTFIVTVGLASILVHSDLAFNTLKIAGTFYLLYLAYKTFKHARQTQHADFSNAQAIAPKKLYPRGVVMSASNPKLSLFFLAFLPQFTSASAGSIQLQLLQLAAIFIATAFVVFSSIAIFSGYFGHLLQRSAKAQIVLQYLTGLVFIGIAINLLLITRH